MRIGVLPFILSKELVSPERDLSPATPSCLIIEDFLFTGKALFDISMELFLHEAYNMVMKAHIQGGVAYNPDHEQPPFDGMPPQVAPDGGLSGRHAGRSR